MKKIFLAITAILFFAVSCNDGGGNTPAGIEKAIYSQLQKGNYEKAVEIMFAVDSKEAKENASATNKEELAAIAEKAKQSVEAQGGIKSFRITKEEISKDGLTAVVTSTIVYGSGKEDTKQSKYVNEDGKWKLSMDK